MFDHYVEHKQMSILFVFFFIWLNIIVMFDLFCIDFDVDWSTCELWTHCCAYQMSHLVVSVVDLCEFCHLTFLRSDDKYHHINDLAIENIVWSHTRPIKWMMMQSLFASKQTNIFNHLVMITVHIITIAEHLIVFISMMTTQEQKSEKNEWKYAEWQQMCFDRDLNGKGRKNRENISRQQTLRSINIITWQIFAIFFSNKQTKIYIWSYHLTFRFVTVYLDTRQKKILSISHDNDNGNQPARCWIRL